MHVIAHYQMDTSGTGIMDKSWMTSHKFGALWHLLSLAITYQNIFCTHRGYPFNDIVKIQLSPFLAKV